MTKPPAILFDLWGTLITSDVFDPAKGNAAVLEHSDNPEGASLERIMETGNRVISELEPWEEKSRLEFTEQSLLRILGDSFGLRFHFPLPEMEWIFWTSALAVSRTEGIGATLDELDRRGIRKGIVSNSSFMGATMERELDRLGLLRHFQIVVSSADYGVRKPSSLIFQVALRRLGVSPSEAWFVGDNVVYDIQGAWAAGMRPIAYRVAPEALPAGIAQCRSISNWKELERLIDSP